MLDRGKLARYFMRAIVVVVIVGASTALLIFQMERKGPPVVTGAIIKQDSNPADESPISDVDVTVANDQAVKGAKSNFIGFFSIPLRSGISRDQPITLQFRHPDYQPLDITSRVDDKLEVVKLVPIKKDGTIVQADHSPIPVANVLIRYSTIATDQENIGTGIKTFQIPNVGNVPCDKTSPCSPDGKWKATVVSESLDAGEGSVFRDARVSCLAGPCPFTRIDTDGFSHGGRTISVSVRNWSDTTTFLMQAEVFRPQINNIVRMEYPIMLDTSLNFTLPPTAEGPTVEADINGENIIFPLGPNPELSWADCNVIVDRNQSKIYRCELKSGYRFGQQQ